MRRITYRAFCDPSGGSSDSMTLAIAHSDEDRAVLDAIREIKPPFSPESVVKEFASLLRSYRIARVTGDKYGGAWVEDQFKRYGIRYEASADPKSDIYRDFLPLLNSGKADLLDHPKMLNQIASLERRTARSGRDTIDHPPGGHDDIANAVAGVLAGIGSHKNSYNIHNFFAGDPADDNERWRAARRNSFILNGGYRLW